MSRNVGALNATTPDFLQLQLSRSGERAKFSVIHVNYATWTLQTVVQDVALPEKRCATESTLYFALRRDQSVLEVQVSRAPSQVTLALSAWQH